MAAVAVVSGRLFGGGRRPIITNVERERIVREFSGAVNMSANELRDWLASSESKCVGWKGADGMAPESVGHASGRRIVRLLAKDKETLTTDDLRHMRKVVEFVRRHLAQQPANPATSRWRYSLMNWGHDPLKD